MMNCFVIVALSTLLTTPAITTDSLAYSCYVHSIEETVFGADRGITGKCSNNNGTVTCAATDHWLIRCTGPGGGYTGEDLDALIFSACDCYNDQDWTRELFG